VAQSLEKIGATSEAKPVLIFLSASERKKLLVESVLVRYYAEL
jgi:hypothetical protein